MEWLKFHGFPLGGGVGGGKIGFSTRRARVLVNSEARVRPDNLVAAADSQERGSSTSWDRLNLATDKYNQKCTVENVIVKSTWWKYFTRNI
jgi:hypothetical protein